MEILNMFKLEDKSALVTGAGRGIGRAFAIAMAESGADIAVCDLDEKAGQHVCDEITALGRRAVYIKTNLTIEDEVRKMVLKASEKLKGLDIAVNCGAAPSKDWNQALDRCLNSVYYCCMEEIEEIRKKKRGKIVNIASIRGVTANASPQYSVSKAGVIMLTKCLARECGGYNINVNSISPVYTLTFARRFDNDDTKQRIRTTTPMGWYARPEDYVGTLLYLVSDASNYITGQNIIVDGGHLLSDWFNPLHPREEAPLVTPQEETASLVHDMDVMGMKYDKNGVALE